MPFVPVLKTTIEVRPDSFQPLLSSPIWYDYWVDEGHPRAHRIDDTRLLRTANGLPTATTCADASPPGPGSFQCRASIRGRHGGGALHAARVARHALKTFLGLRLLGHARIRRRDENVKVMAERLGHAKTAMSLDLYAHVLPGMQVRRAERLETLLFRRG